MSYSEYKITVFTPFNSEYTDSTMVNMMLIFFDGAEIGYYPMVCDYSQKSSLMMFDIIKTKEYLDVERKQKKDLTSTSVNNIQFTEHYKYIIDTSLITKTGKFKISFSNAGLGVKPEVYIFAR